MTASSSARARRTTFIVFAIILPVALVHFIPGPHYRGPFRDFIIGYLIDILLPFAVYFLFSIPQSVLGRDWRFRAIVVFAIGAAVETAQYFGLAVFGQTFDPLDYIMYAGGVTCAVMCDRFIFPRIFTFWVAE